MGNPMPPKHDPLSLLALAVVAFSLTAVAALAATMAVTVPLLWPLAASLGCLWLGVRETDWWLQQHRQRKLDELRERAEAADLLPGSAAVIVGRAEFNGTMCTLIGDAERDVFAEALRSHFAAGRLTQAELEERLAAVLAARTVAELAPTVRDLPNEGTGE